MGSAAVPARIDRSRRSSCVPKAVGMSGSALALPAWSDPTPVDAGTARGVIAEETARKNSTSLGILDVKGAN